MGEKLIVGPVNKGMRNDRTAFVIDNDAFPELQNAYQWRGRVKRKRGTKPLVRLNVYSQSQAAATPLDGSGNGNLFTSFPPNPATSTVVPEQVSITIGSVSYSDTNGDGNLYAGGIVIPIPAGTINYITGAFTIASGATNAWSAAFYYFPELPVMGICDLRLETSPSTFPTFPGTLAFDTTRSYEFNTANDTIYNVSYYKKPTQGAKVAYSPVFWSGQDFQQFWSCNYKGAFWVTNSNPGMHFMEASSAVINSPTTDAVITLTTPAATLKKGDYVFVYEFSGANNETFNGQTGYLTADQTGVTINVTFPTANITAATYTNGIVQVLTASVPGCGDGIRWYDGDPVYGNTVIGSAPPVPSTSTLGWVNFAPPLSKLPNSVGGAAANTQYYLAGAAMIVPFKGRLLFIAPYITSNSGQYIFLQDTIIFNQDGTPFYTASGINLLTSNPTQVAQLVPADQGALPSAFWEDLPGYGGSVSAGVNQEITTATPNQDVLILGFQNSLFVRLVFTGNDLLPFLFYQINSEMGASGTFASVTMDAGAISVGDYGITLTTQNSCQRIDLEIPDQVFAFAINNNNSERICCQRDFKNEWIYFTYLISSTSEDGELAKYPNQTLLYNYRDNSYAVFGECFTSYGLYRSANREQWITLPYNNWNEWGSWGSSIVQQEQPVVVGGTQHGFIVVKGIDTYEAPTLAVYGISGNTVTCYEHCLETNDYIQFASCTGNAATLNGNIYMVANVVDKDSFTITSGSQVTPINPNISSYFGAGEINKVFIPFIQTKQFPIAWDMARKTRIGAQRYLFTTTTSGQIQLLIYLSQNAFSPYSSGFIVPDTNSTNNSLVYSDVLSTCPESSFYSFNITGIVSPVGGPTILSCLNTFGEGSQVVISNVVGMTQLNGNTYNVVNATRTAISIDVDSSSFTPYVSGGIVTAVSGNLMTPFASSQAQLWHRMNTSLIGDTVQIGFTLSDLQLRDPLNTYQEIELHSFVFDISPSQMLV